MTHRMLNGVEELHRGLAGGGLSLASPVCVRRGANTNPERCAIYAREAPLAGSINTQVDICTGAAMRNNWTVDDRFVEVDVDSSEDDLCSRFGLSALVDALGRDEPPFTYLLVSHLSVLSSEEHVAHALINLFNSRGVIVCTVNHAFGHDYWHKHPPIAMFL